VRKRWVGPARRWPPEPNATIDRLAFLAAQAYLLHRARPWWVRLLAAAEAGGGTPRFGNRGEVAGPMPMSRVMTREISGARMADYSFACEFVVGDLSVDERRALRESGTLPSWFFTALEREVRERRATQRAAGF
jgi:hypothetical protein